MHAPVVLGSARDVELPEDVADVGLDRLRRHPQPLGNPAVGEALRHQVEDLPLAVGEVPERMSLTTSREEAVDQFGVDDDLPRGDPVERGDQLARVGYAILEQVPAAGRITVDESKRVFG